MPALGVKPNNGEAKEGSKPMKKSHVKKSTMVKSVVGKVKSSTYNLPAYQHVYGARVVKDEFPAGEVISKWQVSKPSEAETSDRDLIKTNVMAIQAGNLTSKDMRIFQQAHPDIRIRQAVSKLKKQGGDIHQASVSNSAANNSGMIYGIVTKKTEPPLSHLIEARFTDMTRDDMDYPDVMVLRKKHQLPAPRATKASEGHSIRARGSDSDTKKERFVMSKFANVESRWQDNKGSAAVERIQAAAQQAASEECKEQGWSEESPEVDDNAGEEPAAANNLRKVLAIRAGS